MARQNDSSKVESSGPAPAHGSTVAALSAKLRAPLRKFFQKKSVPRDEIDDQVQEVFLRLASRDTFSSTDRLEGYVFRTAANLLRDRHRRRVTRAAEAHETYEDGVHGSVLTTLEPERQIAGSQLISQLVTALYELPQQTRVIFSLYHFEELSHAQISQRLGIAVSTIEKHMGRANARLLARLEL